MVRGTFPCIRRTYEAMAHGQTAQRMEVEKRIETTEMTETTETTEVGKMEIR